MSNYVAERKRILAEIVTAVSNDPRIIGCVDYGSSSEGRSDQWSDLDMALFIQDSEIDAFQSDWKTWVAQFGDLLLAYRGGIGHPWVVYDTGEMPLRVDLNFIPASQIDVIRDWPNAPQSVDNMVLYQEQNAPLTPAIQSIVNQSLKPQNLQQAFDQVCGDLWVYFIRTHVQCLRKKHWSARHDFNFIIVGNLLALCRIEAGKVDRWRGSNAAADIERDLSSDRLQQLEVAKPGPSLEELQVALHDTAVLTQSICKSIASQHGWSWPENLAIRVIEML